MSSTEEALPVVFNITAAVIKAATKPERRFFSGVVHFSKISKIPLKKQKLPTSKTPKKTVTGLMLWVGLLKSIIARSAVTASNEPSKYFLVVDMGYFDEANSLVKIMPGSVFKTKQRARTVNALKKNI